MATAYGVPAAAMSTTLAPLSATRRDRGDLPVVVVAGPTASGKSALALALAEAAGGVVINADSMQVYRELSVLTARPGPGECSRVPHRLYGFRPAATPCSVAIWRDLALAEIGAASDAGLVPVVCGGTGLYLSALIDGLAEMPDVPADVRAAAVALHREIGGAALRSRLATRDPATAARLADGDTQRLVRAWEVVEATGVPISEWQGRPAVPPAGLRFHTVALMPPRADLYAACDGRFDAMLTRGALAEAEALRALNLDPGLPAMKALGVPQLIGYLEGRLTLEEAVGVAKRETRRYAKRQTTWFRHQTRVDQWIEAKFSECDSDKIFSNIRRFLLTGTG